MELDTEHGSEISEFIEVTEVYQENVIEMNTENILASETENAEVEQKPLWTITDMDKTMYAKSSVNVRKGPGAEYEKLGSLSTNQELKVTGKCNEFDWYRIIYNGNESYVNVNYLLDEKVTVNVFNDVETTNTNNQNTNNNESVNSEYIEEEINNTPLTPEPAYGTIRYEIPDDQWQWNWVDVADIWTEYGWARELQDSPLSNISSSDIYDFAKEVYPIREDEGEYVGQRIEYPTFWVYVGDGHY